MATGEVKGVVIVLQKQWLEVRQRVLFTEESPDTYLIIYITAVELVGFHLLELADKLFVDSEVLYQPKAEYRSGYCPRSLVYDSLFESDGMLLKESDKSDTIILHSQINVVLHHRGI